MFNIRQNRLKRVDLSVDINIAGNLSRKESDMALASIGSSSSADSLFNALSQNQNQLASMSNQALNSGIDLYINKNYTGAARQFERAINLNPTSDYSIDASKYLASTYLKLGKTDKAIETYQKAIERNRQRDDLRVGLGNLLFSQNRYDEAVVQYREAVKIYPDATNYFSLGQGYLQTGNFSEAEKAFRNVQRLSPNGPNGHYGLGQTYAKQGSYDKAIQEFEKALKQQHDFYDANLEIGYVYADMGDVESARQTVDYLSDKDSDMATLLDAYINQVQPPKILFAWATSSFNYRYSSKTPVSSLDSYLQNANTAKSFEIKFQFNKDMDMESIENRFNWTIGRSSANGPGEAYNYGMPVPDTEINISPFPDEVSYDPRTLTATLTFTIRQNATANGTIDPSHIEFQFKGKDAQGIAIYPKNDQFSGFSGVA
jgi:tetratricopeptide (TPR) repeat protein